MSLSTSGIWKSGVWETTIWGEGVWKETIVVISESIDFILKIRSISKHTLKITQKKSV